MARKKKPEKQEQVEVIIVEEKPPEINRNTLSHNKAFELWNRVLIDALHCGVGEFLSVLGFRTPETKEDCFKAGYFLMNITEVFPEEKILRLLFFWMKESMPSVLAVWGITSFTSNEFVNDNDERMQLVRFFVAWGYALFKHIDNKDPMPKYVVDKMKQYGLECW